MILQLLVLINLLGFAGVASQPLFYLLALGPVQKKLSAPAYIETRHLLDKRLATLLRVLYYGTLLSVLALTVAAFVAGRHLLGGTAAAAFVLHTADIILALKGNIPINTEIGTWQPDKYPPHWSALRNKWLSIYRIRQVAAIGALVLLLVGGVFG